MLEILLELATNQNFLRCYQSGSREVEVAYFHTYNETTIRDGVTCYYDLPTSAASRNLGELSLTYEVTQQTPYNRRNIDPLVEEAKLYFR